LSALLVATQSLAATLGATPLEQSIEHLRRLRELGFAAASPHCAGIAIEEADIDRFCQATAKKEQP
jgi:hypothetical protein